MPVPIQQQHPAEQITPATTCILLTTGTQDPPTRAIYVATAGTATWTDMDGNVCTDIPLVAGLVLPVAIINIAAITDAVLYGLK